MKRADRSNIDLKTSVEYRTGQQQATRGIDWMGVLSIRWFSLGLTGEHRFLRSTLQRMPCFVSHAQRRTTSPDGFCSQLSWQAVRGVVHGSSEIDRDSVR
jgi:hypothetical protein